MGMQRAWMAVISAGRGGGAAGALLMTMPEMSGFLPRMAAKRGFGFSSSEEEKPKPRFAAILGKKPDISGMVINKAPAAPPPRPAEMTAIQALCIPIASSDFSKLYKKTED